MRYAVWAPIPRRVEVEVGGVRHPMTPAARPGWWTAEIPSCDGRTAHGTVPDGACRRAGDEPAGDPGDPGDPGGALGAGGRIGGGDEPSADYGFVLDGDGPFPDPRSLRQPHGVHGRSRPYDHTRFAWTDHGWRGRPLDGAVLYEPQERLADLLRPLSGTSTPGRDRARHRCAPGARTKDHLGRPVRWFAAVRGGSRRFAAWVARRRRVRRRGSRAARSWCGATARGDRRCLFGIDAVIGGSGHALRLEDRRSRPYYNRGNVLE